MTKNKYNLIGNIALYIVCLVTGFFVGKLVSIPGVSLAKEINPLHGISIFCSFFCVIFVSLLLDKHKEASKGQRQLMLNQLESLLENVEQLSTRLCKEGIEFVVVTSLLKKVGKRATNIVNLFKRIDINKNDFVTRFCPLHKELRDLMTNTPIVSEHENPIQFKKGHLVFSEERIREIEAKIEELKDCISITQLETVSN
jgi:hypothetical protein